MKCMGYCEDGAEAKYPDPKDPPLDVGDCLCRDCYIAHLDECIEEHENELESLRELRDGAAKKS